MSKSRTAPKSPVADAVDWYGWRDGLMNSPLGEQSLGAAVAFEQLALRSKKEKRCAECGERGTVAQPASAYCHVSYWFCDEHDAYWREAA